MEWITRTGARMKPYIRDRIITMMTNPACEGMSQRQIAAEVGVSPRTVRNYLTQEVWQEIKTRRLRLVHDALTVVDDVLLKKALDGDIQAAKVLYSRWDKLKRQEDDALALEGLSVEELDAEIQRMEAEIRTLNE